MPEATSSLRIEDFKPRLIEAVEQFDLPCGDVGLYRDSDGAYIRIPRNHGPILEAMNGESSLSELVLLSTTSGQLLSVRGLLATIRELAHHSWLENDPAALKRHGLGPVAPSRRLFRRLTQVIFALKLQSRGLGSWVEKLFSRGTPARFGYGVLVGILVLSVVLMVTGVALFALSSFGPGDPRWYSGAYRWGIPATYCGAVFGLILRFLFRGALLTARGYGIFSAGLAMRFLLIAPCLDDRHIFRAGKGGIRVVTIAGIAGSSLALGLILCSSAIVGGELINRILFMAALGAGTVVYVSLCPFLSSDLGRFVDQRMPRGEGRQHLNSYLTRRLLKRLGSPDVFEGELYLVWMVTLSIGWIYAGFLMSSSVVSSALTAFSQFPDDQQGVLDIVSVGIVLGVAAVMAVAWILVLLAGIAITLWTHRPRRRVKPDRVITDAQRSLTALKGFPIFAHLTDTVLDQLSLAASLERFKDGADVVRHGDLGETFFVIAKGWALVIGVEDSGLERQLATLGPGDGFGEMALLSSGRRTATVRAHGDLEVVALTRGEFAGAVQRAGISMTDVTTLLRAQHALLASPVFGDMTPGSLSRVVGMCSRDQFEKDEVIIREGERGETFYVIASGTVEIRLGAEDKQLSVLGPGEIFGEVALLFDQVRSATVVARETAQLLALNRESFLKVMTHDFQVAQRIESIAQNRVPKARIA